MDQPRSLWELAGEAAPAVPDAVAEPAPETAPITESAAPRAPMPRLTTRVLDVALGAPAAGIPVVIETVDPSGVPVMLGTAVTDADGRAALADGPSLGAAFYRVTFDLGRYFLDRDVRSCYPAVSVLVQVTDATRDFEIPLLLSPNGYSTHHV